MVLLLWAAAAVSSPAQITFSTVFSYDGTDGSNPYLVGLVQGLDGNLYGTTSFSGGNGKGTVFNISPSGALTTLYNFCAQPNCTDGSLPSEGLMLAKDGNFYGTTPFGGTGSWGTIFKITPAGILTTLHNFLWTDGAKPASVLLQANDGNFYGTTNEGGIYGYGTVFKMTPLGSLTTLYSFCAQPNCADGALPESGLVQATDGNFYGTTYGGEASFGTVYKVTPTGTLTRLYSFCAQKKCADGAFPIAALIQATDGNFYGTTYQGGSKIYYGTVFKITPSGALTVLHSFKGTDGNGPAAGLVQATDGNFYGATYYGTNGNGTLFKITPGGRLATLHTFTRSDGSQPFGTPVQDTSGSFYGVTEYGGTSGYGAIFNLSVGLGPFVKTLPTFGRVGTAVYILGTNLTGATQVLFNGTTAVFTVVSASEIRTTIPAGATTGFVTVTTPSGMLKSNKTFGVIP